MKRMFLFMMVFTLGFMLSSCVDKGDSNEKILLDAYNDMVLMEITYDSIDFFETYDYKGHQISVEWSSSDELIVNRFGHAYRLADRDQEVVLTSTLKYKDFTKEIKYNVIIPAYTDSELLNIVLDSININRHLSNDLDLPTSYDYGIVATWSSSNENILTNDGKLSLDHSDKELTLTLTLSKGDKIVQKTFDLSIPSHFILETIDDFKPSGFNNLKKDGNHLILNDDAVEGYYESEAINTYDFKEVVGSWSVETDINRTTELLVRVKVGSAWSEYFSYGSWGLGLENKGANSYKTLADMSADEIIIKGGKTADAVQYKIYLRRTSTDFASPRLALVALTLNIPNFTKKIDTSLLPAEVDYNVPQLNQNIVPGIGNSICSPTSTTMLLKYKGHDFTSFDEFEHRYIAGVAKDYGNNIYGNWVYNTAVMGALGEKSYVKRLYSLEELQLHLTTVGPVAASVKGNMQGLYTTNGHLIVVRGYHYVDGVLNFICNDPNLKNVLVNYTAETMQTVWRNIIYVVE